jgi:copper chaperone CopZ
MSTIEYTVTGMTCAHCERAVSEEVSRIDGVAGIDVSASSGTLVITSARPVDDAQVVAAVEEAGYSAVRA